MSRLYRFGRITLPLLFSLMFFVIACHENSTVPVQTNSVSGILYDEQNVPVPNAIIDLQNQGMAIAGLIGSDTTDEDGNFVFNNLPTDYSKLSVKVQHSDFKAYSSNLGSLIGSHDKKNVPVKLQHEDSCKAKLVIITRKASDSSAIAAVEVRLSRSNVLIRKAYTSDAGMLTFENVCPGTYWIRLAKYGYRVIEQNVTLEGSQTLNLDAYMLAKEGENDSCCHSVLNLAVKDPSSNSISGATVNIWKSGTKLGEFKTNDAGQVIFRELCPGTYSFSIVKTGYTGTEFSKTFACNDTLSENKTLQISSDSCCHATFTVIPKNKANGEILNGAYVKLWKGGQNLASHYVENGKAVFTNLCPGTYSFNVNKDGYKGIEFSAEITCNGNVELVKEMELAQSQDSCCNGVLNVTAKDSKSGALLTGATIKLWKGSTLLTSLKLEGEKVTFRGLCPADYQVSILMERYQGIEYKVTMACNDTLSQTKLLSSLDSCCNGVLYVTPRDKQGGAILTGANVSLSKNGVTLTTLKVEGEYVMFQKLCPGTYGVRIAKDGYKVLEFSVQLECNDTLRMEKLMDKAEQQDTCCKGILTIKPVNKDNKEAINGVLVKLWKGGTLLGSYNSENGRVTFTNLCPGEYSVSLSKTGFISVEKGTFKYICNEQIEQSIEMSRVAEDTCCNGTLTIRPVDDGTRLPLNGATVKLWKNGTLLTTLTTQEGKVVFTKLCPGSYSIDILKEGYTHVERGPFTYVCNETKDETIGMKSTADTCCKGWLIITVKNDADGTAISGATLSLWKGSTKIQTGTTNAEGRVTLDGICSGDYSYSVTKDGYNGKEFTVSYVCNEHKDNTVNLVKKASDTCCTAVMSIIVRDKNTRAVLANVAIDLYIGDKHVREGVTNAEGRKTFESLCAPNTYTIKAQLTGYQITTMTKSYTQCNTQTLEVEMIPN